MTVLNVYYKCKQDMRDEFLEMIITEGIEAASRAEDGNIKYDYYFELAELYRLLFFKTNKEEFVYESRKYYSMAIEFSSVAGDYNLETMCILGMSLLDMMEGKSMNLLKIREIASNCYTKGLLLNYHCANFLISVLEQNAISGSLIQIYQNFGFGNLYNAATLYKQNKLCYLKLVVM